jgi:hypothetical protein
MYLVHTTRPRLDEQMARHLAPGKRMLETRLPDLELEIGRVLAPGSQALDRSRGGAGGVCEVRR